MPAAPYIPLAKPGGTSGQLQYNASGSFGGAPFSAVAGSGNLVTLTAQADTDVPLALLPHSGSQSVGLLGVGTLAPTAWLDCTYPTPRVAIRMTDLAIAHGMTSLVPTDVVGQFGDASAFGGVLFQGFGEVSNAEAVVFSGCNVGGGSSSSVPVVEFKAGKRSGTSAGNFGPDDLGFSFQQNDNTHLLDIFGSGRVVISLNGASANTSTDGLVLLNPTAATSGNQSFSPRLRLSGQGWKTTSVAGSQTVDWIVENQPVQGTTNPSSNLVIASQINGGGYVVVATLSSGGDVADPAPAPPQPDPHVAGQVWSNSGVLTLSAG